MITQDIHTPTDVVRKKVQELIKENRSWQITRLIYMTLVGPFFIGNAIYALSIPTSHTWIFLPIIAIAVNVGVITFLAINYYKDRRILCEMRLMLLMLDMLDGTEYMRERRNLFRQQQEKDATITAETTSSSSTPTST